MKKVLEALAGMQVKMPIQTVLLVLIIAFLFCKIKSSVIFITFGYIISSCFFNKAGFENKSFPSSRLSILFSLVTICKFSFFA